MLTGTIIITKVSTLTRKITLEDLTKIYLVSDALHVMIKDTSPETVPETKEVLKRRRTTKEDIILIPQKMMNLQERKSKKKTLLVMKNMF